MAAIGLFVVLIAVSGCQLFGPPGDTTPPRAVSSLSAAAGDQEVVLTWTDPSDADLDHIEVGWQPGSDARENVSAGSQSYTITGLTNGTEYTFTVWAIDTAGNESTSVSVRATPVGARVSYDANGADLGTAPTDATVYTPGDTIDVLGNPGGLSKADHTFAGWNTAADGSGMTYSGGQSFQAPSGDVTLYAVWNPTLAVSVEFSDPANPDITFTGTSDEVSRGTVVSVTAPGGYTGYTWYLDGTSTSSALSSTDEQATIDTTTLGLGSHTVSVVLAEGYSGQFSFQVVE
jgi:uncharacterized repeat protein (TIGR02543 family)